VRVNVDEPGREYLALRVDRLGGGLRRDATDARNASVFDRHVGAKPRIAAAVDEACVGDYEIVGGPLRAHGLIHAPANQTPKCQRNQGQQGRLEETRLHFL